MAVRDLEQHTMALAEYLPNGRTFEAKNIDDSNLRNLIRGLSGELMRAQNYISTLEKEYFPDATTLFIDEWESALGIPDSCLSGTGTNDERRRDILVKLASLGVQTADDFIDLAEKFGVTVKVNSGIDEITFPLTFPALFFNENKTARYTIVVRFTGVAANTFPLTFPFVFGTNELAILECLFNKLKPTNCDIIFLQV